MRAQEPLSEPGITRVTWRQPRPVAWVTWLVLGSTVSVFLLQLHELHRTGDDVVGDTLAFSPAAMAEGRWWTLVTYAWAHAVAMFGDSSFFWLHIVANMIPLVCLGPAVEELLGHWRFLGLYLGAAIFSALTWYAFDHDAGDQAIIGASGAIFGLITAAGTAAPRMRVNVYLFFVIPISMSLRVLALAACGAEIVQVIFGWFPEIAHSAHLGGGAFGFLYVGAWWLAAWLRARR
jgi:membrane associated rhomboid family serine protease